MRPLFPLTKPTFFFQAADGIRVIGVTGVQTCALPIYFSRTTCSLTPNTEQTSGRRKSVSLSAVVTVIAVPSQSITMDIFRVAGSVRAGGSGSGSSRSEERRVGREWERR